MREILTRGLEALGVDLDRLPALEEFSRRLLERNQVMNLTAITDPAEVATLHFLDSLCLLPMAEWTGKAVVDVGTGAGFPGLPLRILEPTIRLTLLDSLGKRVQFLESVCRELGLTDVSCIHSRAVAALPVLCELCLPLVRPGGKFLAMKSVESDQELASAGHAIATLGGAVAAVRDYVIPGTQVRHRLIIVEKAKKTPEKYPRMFAKIKKNPL